MLQTRVKNKSRDRMLYIAYFPEYRVYKVGNTRVLSALGLAKIKRRLLFKTVMAKKKSTPIVMLGLLDMTRREFRQTYGSTAVYGGKSYYRLTESQVLDIKQHKGFISEAELKR